MKREIIFRGKCSHCDVWAYGNLVYFGEDEMPEIHGFDPYKEGDNRWREITVDPDTVGQFTGIKDMNGIDIYEGDIVHCITTSTFHLKAMGVYGQEVFLVTFTDGVWRLNDNFARLYDYGCGDKTNIEVIGNIYDNKELLKQCKIVSKPL